MATVFMVKRGNNPVDFYSTYPQSASISSDVVEMDLPIIEGASKGCVFMPMQFIVDVWRFTLSFRI